MPKYVPPLPPHVVSRLSEDPFERWLETQAALGHNKHWLRRNAPALRKRWEADPTLDLPAPLPPREPKIGDRYSEL